LATHAGTTIIVDNQSLLQRSSAVVISPLIIRDLWLMLQLDVADAYLCGLAPHDRTMARFAILGLQYEFSGTKNDVGGHQLGHCIRHVEYVATHGTIAVIEDDQCLL
jgi:hypothetical protein